MPSTLWLKQLTPLRSTPHRRASTCWRHHAVRGWFESVADPPRAHAQEHAQSSDVVLWPDACGEGHQQMQQRCRRHGQHTDQVLLETFVPWFTCIVRNNTKSSSARNEDLRAVLPHYFQLISKLCFYLMWGVIGKLCRHPNGARHMTSVLSCFDLIRRIAFAAVTLPVASPSQMVDISFTQWKGTFILACCLASPHQYIC